MSRDNSKKDGQSQVITPAPIDVMRDTLATEIKPLWTGDDSKPFWSGDDDALFWGGGAEHARELKSRLLEAFGGFVARPWTRIKCLSVMGPSCAGSRPYFRNSVSTRTPCLMNSEI